ncbi:MAG: hypothetical protein M3Y55_15120 [Pseudomonadota bacterium]|nr:hypothetical protein [Pseudomonadota bacterium]
MLVRARLLMIAATLSCLTISGAAMALGQAQLPQCGSCGGVPFSLSANQLVRYDFVYGPHNGGTTTVLSTGVAVFLNAFTDTTRYACVDERSMDRLSDDLRSAARLRVPDSQRFIPYPRGNPGQLLLFRIRHRQKTIDSNQGDPTARPMPSYARRLIGDLVALQKQDQRHATGHHPKRCPEATKS